MIPVRRLRRFFLRVATVLPVLAGSGGWATPACAADADPPAFQSATAERVYFAARPRLLQIRTLVEAAGRQSTIGSGFLVGPDGLAMTNYHVVSQYALEPAAYRLEYAAPDGSHGAAKLLAFDIGNDLALVQLDRKDLPFFEFDRRTLAGEIAKGERLYSMGNPLDLGFTIVEGTYNGSVERSYNERIHFSGAINPGMSGGPTVAADGGVVGVNVAKQFGGELVSFLVPARFAKTLLDRARNAAPLAAEVYREEIGRQLTSWQAGLYGALAGRGFRASSLGPYRAPESVAPWFTCWANTNADAKPKPRARVSETNCRMQTAVFIAGDLQTGQVTIGHSYVSSIDLNAFQFSAFLSHQYQPSWGGSVGRKRLTAQRCHEDFVGAADAAGHPLLRALWCARAYREFEDLYDVVVVTVTQDRAREALISRLDMRGVTYDNAMLLGRQFLTAVGRVDAAPADAAEGPK
jgi:S1-C subfamily serine protease